eukprot:8327060-Karenia_brevis.AAC.1
MMLPDAEDKARQERPPVAVPPIPKSWTFGVSQTLEQSANLRDGDSSQSALLKASLATPPMITTGVGAQKKAVKKTKSAIK